MASHTSPSLRTMSGTLRMVKSRTPPISFVCSQRSGIDTVAPGSPRAL